MPYSNQQFEYRFKMGELAAVPCGKAKRVPVRIQCNGVTQSELLANYGAEPFTWIIVIAESAKAAADYVRDFQGWPPNTQIMAISPRGGKIERFIGFESYISRSVFGSRNKGASNGDLFETHQRV